MTQQNQYKQAELLTSKDIEKIMRKLRSSSSFSVSLLCFSLLLILIALQKDGIFRVAEAGKTRVHIPDDLDDVTDDEEDQAWKDWGKKSIPSDPPIDPSTMELSEIQSEMMKRNRAPLFGFVKLRFGVGRTAKMVPEIAMKWTNVLKTGSIKARFMAVDVSTLMFNMENAQDLEELIEFVLNQHEAYEVKIGEQVYRRPGDPPLDEVVEMLHSKEDKANDHTDSPKEEEDHSKEEL